MAEGGPPKPVVIYTVAWTVVSAIGFLSLLTVLPGNRAGEPLPGEAPNERVTLVLSSAVMFGAGVLGGSLYSLRGLAKHASLADYDRSYDVSYYLRPLSSGISGLLVFFLLLGGALTLSIGGGASTPGWATFTGRLPYIAFSLLAGYGAQEFMAKLKDLADSLFAIGRS